MINEKQRKKGILRFLLPTALILLVPAAVRSARLDMGFLGDLGARAAMVSAAVNMPDGGLELIRERFRSELYGEDAWNAPQNAEHPQLENPNISPTPGLDEQSPEPETESGGAVKPPKIPTKYAAELVSEDFGGHDGKNMIAFGSGLIKNDTKKSPEEIEEILEDGHNLEFSGEDEPQVLIFHTHATESFERYDTNIYDTRNTWRSTDNNNNMVAVGNVMRQVLEENEVGVLHDTTQHDYPSYNGSYERSAETVEKYLEEYPSIKVVLDLHRDAMQRDNQVIVKPVATIDGQKAAQIMIIAGCDDGTMDMPNWPQNLRFAAALQDAMESRYPGLTRPIYFCYRKYNMDLSNGSLLLEFGSNANTLDEALYSARLAGQALADMISGE